VATASSPTLAPRAWPVVPLMEETGGGIEAVATVLAISRGQIPPNIGLREQDPDIPLHRIVTERQEWEPGLAVSNSFGFGGHNTVLVFGPGS